MSDLVVWRLCSAKHAANAYSGEGAKLVGGRWSPAGIRLVYAAESRALTVVEVLANADESDRLFFLNWVLVPAEVPPEVIERPARVPDDWHQYPHPNSTQAFGADWVQSRRSVALRVPSAVVPGEFNYLLNPAHPRFARVKIGKPQPFAFDPRLAPAPQRR